MKEHERVHKLACSQLMGMTAYRMGCTTPDIVRMAVRRGGWAVAAVQDAALPRSPFSAGKMWAKEGLNPFRERYTCSHQ